jgi:hypothetical protein
MRTEVFATRKLTTWPVDRFFGNGNLCVTHGQTLVDSTNGKQIAETDPPVHERFVGALAQPRSINLP